MKIWKDLSLLIAGSLSGPLLQQLEEFILKENSGNNLWWILLLILFLLTLLFGSGLLGRITEFMRKNIFRRINILSKKVTILAPFDCINDSNSSWAHVDNVSQLIQKIQSRGFSPINRVVKLSKSFSSYPILLNPYGGCYPENIPSEKETFKKILDYVKNGGVFINIADIPFYYMFCKDYHQKVDTTSPTTNADGSHSYSFNNTLVSRNLNVSILAPKKEEDINDSGYRCFVYREHYEEYDDKDFEYRKGRSKNELWTRVIAVPYGKGYFVFSTKQVSNTDLTNEIEKLLKISWRLLGKSI